VWCDLEVVLLKIQDDQTPDVRPGRPALLRKRVLFTAKDWPMPGLSQIGQILCPQFREDLV
jgi:hypothetical protein